MTATDPALSPELAGQRFSEWLEGAPIGRTAARELMAGLGIEPARVRLPGISAAVAWLNPEQVAAMDEAAARVAAGQSVAQVVAAAGGDPDPPAPIRDRSRPDADPGQLALMVAAVVGALDARRDALQPVAALPAPPSPLARAQALQQAAREALMLTSAELAEITGLPVEAINGLRDGGRLQGYRLRRIRPGRADPGPLWQLQAPTAATDRD